MAGMGPIPIYNILVGECSAFLASGSDPTDSDGQSMRKTMKIIIDHIQISRRLYNCDHSTSTSTEVITVSSGVSESISSC